MRATGGARHALVAVAAVVAAAGLVLLATWAATVGPGDVLRRDGSPPAFQTPTGGPPVSLGTAEADPDQQPRAERDGVSVDGAVVATVVRLVVAALVALVTLAVGRRLLAAWRRRPPRLEPELVPDDGPDPPSGPARLRASLEAALAEQEQRLETGTARNAVVECWHELEQAAAGQGLPRRPAETTAEFTLRLLDAAASDRGAATRLADLYREARFSEHPVGEQQRSEARSALAVLRASLATSGRVAR